MSRRWKQISLRSLLLVLFTCAMAMALWPIYIQPYYLEQQALDQFEGKQFIATTEAVGPAWLGWFADGKYSQRVVWVDLGADTTDRDLERLRHFARLRTVMIATAPEVTDYGLSRLVANPGIRALMLRDTQVTDDGLRQLQKLPELHELYIASDRLSNDGLAHIGKLHELRELAVRAPITDAGMRHLLPLTKLHTLRCWGLRKSVQRVQSLLTTPVGIQFSDIPLCDALDALQDLHGMTISMDRDAMHQAGIEPTMTFVTIQEDGNLRQALTAILTPNKLDYCIASGGLVITTEPAMTARRPATAALCRALPVLRVVDVGW